MDGRIELDEVPLVVVNDVGAHVHGDRVVLILDGKPFAINRASAVALAFSLCAQIDAMDTLAGRDGQCV